MDPAVKLVVQSGPAVNRSQSQRMETCTRTAGANFCTLAAQDSHHLLTAKKEARTGTSFRQGHHSIPDSQSGRLQMLSLAQASVHRVHPSLRIKKPVQGLSAAADRVGIHPLVHLGHRVEQAPRCSGLELLVTGFTPFTEHLGNLRRRDRRSVERPDYDVVRTLVGEQRLVVAEDPPVETIEFASKFAHGSCSEVAQVAQGKPGVLAGDLHLATERQIIATEYFGACH